VVTKNIKEGEKKEEKQQKQIKREMYIEKTIGKNKINPYSINNRKCL
jgi:hypothetical protein